MKKKIHISIVGLGHIGGSLAASLKKNYGSKISIVGIDKNRSVLNKAKSSKLFDEVATLKKSQQVINSEIAKKVLTKLALSPIIKEIIINEDANIRLKLSFLRREYKNDKKIRQNPKKK